MSKQVVRSILNKEEILDMDYTNFVLEASVSSSRYGVIKEIERNSKVFSARANINALLVMPFGSHKTSSLVDVKEAVLANDISFPGLIGSINKDGELVEGSCLKAGGKVLLIDEFQKMDVLTKNAMNSLLEYPHTYSRTLGFKLRTGVNKKGKYWSVKAKAGDNTFTVFSKFSCVAAGMYATKKMIIDKAWFSRFVPIRMIPTSDYYKKVTSGEVILRLSPTFKELDFTFDDYLGLHKLFWSEFEKIQFFKKNPLELGYSSRFLQDLCRLSAFIASLDNRTEITKDDYTLSVKFLRNMAASYITANLDEIDVYILTFLAEKSEKEIAEQLNMSLGDISYRISELKKKGVVF